MIFFTRLVTVLLIVVVAPLAGFFQRINLHPFRAYCRTGRNPLKKAFYRLVICSLKLLNWFCEGILTMAYPSMQYDPIATRRQAKGSQWAAAILKTSPDKLQKIARHFLHGISSANAVSFHETGKPTFTVLICFHQHLTYFKSCLDSIATACKQTPEAEVEILIVNDDPSIDASCLLKRVPEVLRSKIKLVSNEQNLGICYSTNLAIQQARGSWILHLDCDDRLMPPVFEVLTKTIQQHPNVRYISSRALDMNEQEEILLWRLRAEEPSDLIKNNVASHLKAIRKDLHDDLGFFNAGFEGCQDYEFALRTAINEPLCFIPHYLYQYRWHSKSQTVGRSARQNETAMRIRQTYLLAIFWITHGTKNISWKITGPHAASWQERLVDTSDEGTSYNIALEAVQACTERRWKLLLVKVAALFIDHFRTDSSYALITLKT